MKLRQKCAYCGNTSGKLDDKGGCITCGAFLSLDVEENLVVPPIVVCEVVGHKDLIWNGITGSRSNLEYERMVRGLVRRSVGLDENA